MTTWCRAPFPVSYPVLSGERASRDVQLYPGDVIGSGTVGTGCLLELTKGQGPWLQPGDVVELEIERLGVIKNEVRL